MISPTICVVIAAASCSMLGGEMDVEMRPAGGGADLLRHSLHEFSFAPLDLGGRAHEAGAALVRAEGGPGRESGGGGGDGGGGVGDTGRGGAGGDLAGHRVDALEGRGVRGGRVAAADHQRRIEHGAGPCAVLARFAFPQPSLRRFDQIHRRH